MGLIVNDQLPNTYLADEDGDRWEPPEEVKKFMAWMFGLDPQDYMKIRQLFSPMPFLSTACKISQNPLLGPMFNHMVMEDYFAYRAAFTPPPGSSKQ